MDIKVGDKVILGWLNHGYGKGDQPYSPDKIRIQAGPYQVTRLTPKQAIVGGNLFKFWRENGQLIGDVSLPGVGSTYFTRVIPLSKSGVQEALDQWVIEQEQKQQQSNASYQLSRYMDRLQRQGFYRKLSLEELNTLNKAMSEVLDP